MHNMKKEPLKVEITEMFMAEANGKCFYGTIKRSKDSEGNPHLFSRITVNKGMIQACASDQKILGRILDEMCVMFLNHKIHDNSGAFMWVDIYDCESDRETEMHVKEKTFLN